MITAIQATTGKVKLGGDSILDADTERSSDGPEVQIALPSLVAMAPHLGSKLRIRQQLVDCQWLMCNWANAAAAVQPKNDGGLFEDGAIHGADGLFHHMPINCASELERYSGTSLLIRSPNRTWVKSPNAVQGRGGEGGREGRGCGGEGVGALGGRQPLYL